MINFGNPFHDKRGDSFVPEKFSNQRPPLHIGENGGPSTPPGSPPHDAYDSHSPVEGEGEAAFTGSGRSSPPRGSRKGLDSKLISLGQKRAAISAPPLDLGDEKRRKLGTPEKAAEQADAKEKPLPPPASPHSPTPQDRKSVV